MTHQIPCPNCQASNSLGSKFCNNCGARLPPSTKILCPHCQTPNPRDRFYCDNCGKRLIEENLPKEEVKPEKGSPKKFSLPERDATDLSSMDPRAIPDWMKTSESRPEKPSAEASTGEDLPSIEELAPLRKTTDELPNWLVDEVYSSAPPFQPPKEITTDHFLELLKATEEDMGELTDDIVSKASEANLPDWLSEVVSPSSGSAKETAKPRYEIPKPPQPEKPEAAAPSPVEQDEAHDSRTQAEETFSDWFDELESIEIEDDIDEGQSTGILKTSEFAEQVLGGDELPDWLQELEPPQTGELGKETPAKKPSPADDYPVSGIFESEEFAAQVREALGTDEVPDWLRELGSTSTKSSDEETIDREPPGDIREWMTQLGPPTGIPDAAGVPDFEDLKHIDSADIDEDDEIYDWLKEPAATDTASADTTSSPIDFTDVFADDAATTIEEEENPLDWLTDLESTETAVSETTSIDDSYVDEPLSEPTGDWLAELSATNSQLTEEDDDELPSSATGDWLAELSATNSQLTEEEEDEDFVDDFFQDDFFQAAAPSASKAIDDVATDWLNELEAEEIATPAAETDETLDSSFFVDEDEIAADDDDDWLSELGPAYTAELVEDSHTRDRFDDDDRKDDRAKPTAELPDWLTELGPPQTNILEPPSDDAEIPALAPTDGLPDLFGADVEQEDVLPDWLSLSPEESTTIDAITGSLDDEADAETAVPSPDFLSNILPDDTQEVDLDPDWLAEITSLGAEAFTGELTPPEPEKPAPDIAVPHGTVEEPISDELPVDFEGFFDFRDEEEEEQEPVEEPSPLDEWIMDEVVDEGDVPEWLSQLGQPASESDSDLTSTPKDELVVEDLPQWLSHMRPSTEDHISSLAGLSNKDPLAADAFDNIPAELIGADLPDWLEDVTQSSFTTEGDQDHISEDIPDIPAWLKLEGGDKELLGAQAEITNQLSELLEELPPARDPLDDLVKADIPDWIRAMKPKDPESEPEKQPERPLQESGPLSGIRGVVEIEPIIAASHTEVTVLPDFQITKEQQQQMSLLRQLSYDTTIRTAAASTTKRASAIRHTILALLLIGAILAGLFGPNLLRDEAADPTVSLSAVHTAIQDAAGKPVLVAFEYTPAMAAELTPQAHLVLSQLAANESPIVLVSQYTTGIAMAVNEDQVYVPGTPFFLPGEAIGLRELANCMNEPCTTIAGHIVKSDLQTTLRDVALVIVFTGEQVSLVNWIEQIGSPDTRALLLGVPQSLQPIAAPYVASGQIKGLISGLPDTAVYAQTYLTKDNDITTRLNAQHLAQILVLILLIIGGVMAVFTRPASPSKSKKQQS